MTGKKRQAALENTLKKCFNEIMESDSNRRESTISNVSGQDFIKSSSFSFKSSLDPNLTRNRPKFDPNSTRI